MNWVLIAIASYLFTAVANILDKLLLNKFLKAASIYVFYVGALGVLAVVLIPFGVVLPSLYQLVFALITGSLFIAALYMMYTGFLYGETTRVATLIGGSLPIFTFIISFIFLGERLSFNQLFAFVFLILGMGAITFEALARSVKKTRTNSYIRVALISGLLFSLTFVGSDVVYADQGFISGFFWMRMGAFLGAGSLLLVPLWRNQIYEDYKAPVKEQTKSKGLMLTNQAIGAAGFILLNLAIDISPSVTLVNALQGLQYLFLFILAAIIGRYIKEVREPSNGRVIFEKTIAIIFILTGLYFLAI